MSSPSRKLPLSWASPSLLSAPSCFAPVPVCGSASRKDPPDDHTQAQANASVPGRRYRPGARRSPQRRTGRGSRDAHSHLTSPPRVRCIHARPLLPPSMDPRPKRGDRLRPVGRLSPARSSPGSSPFAHFDAQAQPDLHHLYKDGAATIRPAPPPPCSCSARSSSL